MNATTEKALAWTVAWGALGGLLVGALIGTAPFWPELMDRWRWTGGGERADWGEPAFYAVLSAIPTALAGAVLGAAVLLAVRALRRRTGAR